MLGHDATLPAADRKSFKGAPDFGPTAPTADLLPRLMPEREAALYLSLAGKTLRNLRSRGGGPPFIRLLSGRIAYRVSDLDAWVSSRQFQSTSEY
uniref:Transcriptional regulator n=1 Tax=Xanthobacter autotrophicus TaxID=280 RepID=A0A168S4M4_XANAU|nr:transcriptional regulator [Xanthobacter autotrophicus]